MAQDINTYTTNTSGGSESPKKVTGTDISAKRALDVNVLATVGSGSGTEYTEGVAAATDPVGGTLLLRRRDSLSSETSANGDNVAVNATNKGEVYVKHVDAIPVTDNGGSITVDGIISSPIDLTASGSFTGGRSDNSWPYCNSFFVFILAVHWHLDRHNCF